jgi:hypothetical protein
MTRLAALYFPPGDRRKRGYLVTSDADELKIRSFLQMFFSAQLSILVLGYFLASEWSREIYHALGNDGIVITTGSFPSKEPLI